MIIMARTLDMVSSPLEFLEVCNFLDQIQILVLKLIQVQMWAHSFKSWLRDWVGGRLELSGVAASKPVQTNLLD